MRNRTYAYAHSIRLTCIRLCLMASLLLPIYCGAQDVTNPLNIGVPPNGMFTGSAFDSVQVNNGNVHMEIPLWSLSGRGLGESYKYIYDSKGFYIDERMDHQGLIHDTVRLELGSNMSWRLFGTSASVSHSSPLQTCLSSSIQTYTNYVVTDENGSKHHFLPDPVASNLLGQNCWPVVTTLYADDGSGWVLQISSSTGTPSIVTRKDGTTFYQGVSNGTIAEDSNGNQLSYNSSNLTLKDTLGRVLPTDGSYYDSAGTQRGLSITTQAVPIQTNFCPTGADVCNDYAATWTPPKTIMLPNGMTYSFTYDLSGGPTHPYYGEPLTITLPTGGQISYTWSGAADGGPNPVTRTVSGDPGPWKYSGFGGTGYPGSTTTATVTDPAGNDTVSTCTNYIQSVPLPPALAVNAICYVTQVQHWQGPSTGGGTLLKTEKTDYSNTNNNTGFVGPVLPIRITTTLNDTNQVSKVETDWDSMSLSTGGSFSWQNPTERRDFDYGSGSAGAQIRTTDYAYLHWPTNTSYRTANIADRLTSKKIYSGTSSGTLVAQVTNTYDGVSPTSTSSTPAPNHDYTNFDYLHNLRGNLTQASRWLKRTGTFLNTNYTYDDLGNRLSMTDPGLHQTTYSYTDNWQNNPCSAGPNSFGYLTKTTDAGTHQFKSSFYSCTGLTAITKDQNDINASRTGTMYTYDLMNRLLTKSLPDGGSVTKAYTDTGSISVQTTELITSSPSLNVVKTDVLDGLGRIYQEQLQDPDCTGGPVIVAYGYGYNLSSNTSFTTKTNPYCGTSSGTTTSTFDALGRLTNILEADASQINMTYSGNQTSRINEAIHIVTTQTDGLGRLTKVWEAPACCNYETDYTYDVLDNLTNVSQLGTGIGSARVRSFTYDSLSRLTCAANPEVTSSTASAASCPATDTTTYTNGTTLYTYDSDGNVTAKQAPAPNQTSTATDTTNYSYDVVHRLISKSYSGGATTASVKYGFDGNTLTGCTTTPPTITPADGNPIGYRTSMCDGSGATSWTHDPLGRVLADKQTIVGSANSSQLFVYAYNKDGSEASLQYPSGRTITYAPNAAGRIVSAEDTANGINYAFNGHYAPHGGVSSFTNHALINAAFSYNSRLQPLQIFYGTNSVPAINTSTCPTTVGNIMHRVYHYGEGGSDVGYVRSIDNCRDTNRSVTFTYDNLERIISATTTGTSCVPGCWGQLFGHMSGSTFVPGIDPWGNLFEITATQGSPTTLSQTVNVKNQFSGMTYDSAGNLTNDGGGHTYTYDDENRLTATAGWTYVYDGDGRRAKKCSSCSASSGGTLSWRAAGTDALVDSDLAGALTHEYILFNGRRIAWRDNTANPPYYYFSDSFGSMSGVMGTGGAIKDESDYYPFGGEVVMSNTAPQNYKFEGKENDAESSLDYFEARHYSYGFARFMQPDWSALPTDVPYATFTDPQTLNLYGFVRNNPMLHPDNDGHCCDQEFDFGIGILRGIASSVSFGFYGSPKSGDSAASVAGQLAGTAIVGTTGEAGKDAGAGTAVVGLAAEGPSLGTSTFAVGVGALGSAVGSALEIGAAANVARITAAPLQMAGGPKANNAPGVTSGGQATDEHGNKLGPSGKPQVNESASNTREVARNKALNEGSGAVEHANPQEGDPHFHPTDNQGNKKPSSTHHTYPKQ